MPASLLHQLNNLDVLTSALMGGVAVQLQPISGDVPVLQVSIEGRDELPIFVTCSDTQIICICYLWTDDDVRAERRAELLEALLDLNPSVPLYSFGRVGKRFVLAGQLTRVGGRGRRGRQTQRQRGTAQGTAAGTNCECKGL